MLILLQETMYRVWTTDRRATDRRATDHIQLLAVEPCSPQSTL